MNGGSAPEANREDFRRELQGQNAHFGKGKKVTVLDAGGPGTRYVPEAINADRHDLKELERSPTGYLVFETEPLGIPSKMASKANLIEAYRALGLTKDPAYADYADHGGPQGIHLWNGETLTAHEHLQYQKKYLPRDKLYRSLHTHCFSDAGFVDPRRKEELPKVWADWVTHLEKFYRKNSCHLGVGLGEMTKSAVSSMSKPEEAWQKLLAAPNSLKILAERYRAEKSVNSTVSLSSDLLMDDVFSFLCSQKRATTETRVNQNSHQSMNRGGRELTDDPCAPGAIEKVIKAERASQEMFDLMDEERQVRQRIAIKVIEKRAPKEFPGWMMAMKEQEKKMKNFPRSPSPEQVKQMEREHGEYLQKWEGLRLQVEALVEPKKLDSTFDKEMKAWETNADKETEAPFLSRYLKKLATQKIVLKEGPDGEPPKEMEFGRIYDNACRERRDAIYALRKKQVAYVKGEINRRKAQLKKEGKKDDPELHGILALEDYYETMLRCEDSKLN